MDLESGQTRNVKFQRANPLNLDVPPALPVWNLYRVVETIAALPDGLAICGRKNRWRKISLSKHGTIRISEFGVPPLGGSGAMPPEGGTPDFRPLQTRCGCTLHVAKWPNGSKVFLDSRGLLHFKSHDLSVPEVSLVLSEGDVAGWTSDGHVCGPPFFFEGQHHSEPLEIFERLRQFLARL
jgi:hypothetical protein